MEKTLRAFLDQKVQSHPDSVARISSEVPLEFVIPGSVLELESRRKYPILRFENVSGFDIPHVTNVFATRERIADAIDIETERFHEAWNERLEQPVPTRERETGPIHNNVLTDDDVDIPAQLPVPRHFEGDAGRYITGGIVIAKDPKTGVRNLAYARTQLKGPRKAGISVHSRGDLWEYLRKAEDSDEPLEVAMVIGAHPSIYVGASASPAIDIDEYEIIGAVRQDPVEVVSAETVDVEVPCEAEIVIEGTIDPGEYESEGPFGEYTGLMSGRSTNNVLRVKALTYRDDPLYLGVTPANSSEHLLLAQTPKEPKIYTQVKAENPYVTDMNMPKSGTLYHCFISIDKSKPGQPMQTILSALGAWRYLKLVVVVDNNIDVRDERDVWWAIATCVQADEDVHVFPDAVGNQLDPSSDKGLTDKLGIDATRSLDGEYTYCEIPDNYAERVGDLIDAEL